MGLKYEAKARMKTVYSIWNKMEKKQVPFEEIYDIYAMRIIFDCDDPDKEKLTCWNIYSIITDLYRLHPDRTRDWISVPKANGYQALHITVMGPDGNWIEVQIRSRRMDEIAEKGFAAHWKYKIGDGEEESELNVWLRTIKDILDNPEPSAIDFLDTLKLNLFASEIVVFTPKGELLTLPNNSTVLDVAFELHSQLGLHCIAGKVNHKLVPLSHKLKSGDQVEVLTSNSQQPKAEWVNFLATAKAKTRLRAALRKSQQPVIAEGKKIFVEFLQKHSLVATNEVVTKILGMLHLPNREELYLALGGNEVTLNDNIAKQLARQDSQSLLSKIFRRKSSAKKTAETQESVEIDTAATYILKHDEHGANFKIADCCCPIPGDEVLGFIDENNEVVVHALDCPRASVLKAGYGSRIVSTQWDVSSGKFLATVHIEGLDRFGILQELTQMISTNMSIDIRKLNIEAQEEVFSCELVVLIEDSQVVTDLCNKINKINGVKRVSRVY